MFRARKQHNKIGQGLVGHPQSMPTPSPTLQAELFTIPLLLWSQTKPQYLHDLKVSLINYGGKNRSFTASNLADSSLTKCPMWTYRGVLGKVLEGNFGDSVWEGFYEEGARWDRRASLEVQGSMGDRSRSTEWKTACLWEGRGTLTTERFWELRASQ